MANHQSTDEKKVHEGDRQSLSIREQEKKVDIRLREIIGNESLASFSRRCGISEGGLRKYFEGASPSTTNLIAMADTANVNIEWLAAGRGHKFRNDVTDQKLINESADLPADMSVLPNATKFAKRLLESHLSNMVLGNSESWIPKTTTVAQLKELVAFAEEILKFSARTTQHGRLKGIEISIDAVDSALRLAWERIRHSSTPI